MGALQQALTELHAGVGGLYGDLTGELVLGSPVANELDGYTHKASLGIARSAASILIESAGEYLTLFVKSVGLPAEPIACCGCVRSLLESCAYASWMIDPAIDRTERVSRVLAYGREDLSQQLGFAQASKEPGASRNVLKARIKELDLRAIQVRASTAKDRSQGRRKGRVRMPDATSAVATMLDEEVTYRLLSAVVHGHSWAMQAMGFDAEALPAGGTSTDRIYTARIRKALKVDVVAWLGLIAARAFCQPVWYLFLYEGWDTVPLQRTFEDSFDHLRAAESIRFWR